MNAYKDAGNFTLFWDAMRWIHLVGVKDALAAVPVGNFPPAWEGLSLQDFKRVAPPITLSVKTKRYKRRRLIRYTFRDVSWDAPAGGKPCDVAGIVVYARTPSGAKPLGFVSVGHSTWEWGALPGDKLICEWNGRAAMEASFA